MQAAVHAYTQRNGFAADGGASEAWVRFSVGPLHVIFPNSDSRRRAIVHHDMHHVATGYQTTVVGEAEIGAWELASGCGAIPVAWVLNSVALAGGLFVNPKRVGKAYARGLHSRNTYGQPSGALYAMTLGELQAHLGLGEPEPTVVEWARFIAVAARSVVTCGTPALLVFLGPALATTAWDAARAMTRAAGSATKSSGFCRRA